MKGILKFLIFTGLLFSLFFAFSSEKTATHKGVKLESNSFFSQVQNHNNAFIEPNSPDTIVVSSKNTEPVNLLRWFYHYLDCAPNFEALPILTSYFTLTLSRADHIALLLFPFHFFW